MRGIRLRALTISVGTISFITLLSTMSESPVFFYLLYPGVVASLLITGGHGGTQFEEAIAPPVAFIVNAFVYAPLIAAVLAIYGRARRKRTRASI
jgi:hypothetical protein